METETNLQLRIDTADPAHVQISRNLERLISSGALKPGDRLPSNPRLAKKWGVSCTSVQRAMKRLMAAGRIERTPGRGTFVKARTEKALIGAMFGPSLTAEPSHFYRSLNRTLHAEAEKREWVLRTYDGFIGANGTTKPINSTVCRHFEADLHQHSFSGLIEVQVYPGTDAGREARTVLPAARWGPPSSSDAALDGRDFIKESVRFLAAQGRRRLCYVSFTSERKGFPFTQAKDEAFAEVLDELRLPQFRSRPIVLADIPSTPERAIYENALHTMREWFAPGNEAQRPDGLVVDDDIGMRAVAMALLRLGVDVPGQLMVVTEANEDSQLHYGIPVVRYEISPREVACELLDILWKRIANEPLPELPILIQGKIREDARK